MIYSRTAMGLQRAAARSSGRTLPSTTRRKYTKAADAIKGEGQGNIGPYTIGALLVGVPLVYYLWTGATTPANQEVLAGGGGSEAGIHKQIGGGSSDASPARPSPVGGGGGGSGDIAAKQAGLSTGVTAHSLPLSQNPTQSNKGEGVVDSAKLSETVRSERPMSRSEGARENQEARKVGDAVNKPS